MEYKSLKDCTDKQIHTYIDQALAEIRESPKQCGEIIISVSFGNVKYIDLKKPLDFQ